MAVSVSPNWMVWVEAHRLRLLSRIVRLRWHWVFVFAVLLGVTLIGWSQTLGVWEFKHPANSGIVRDVGYGAAVKWSVGYVVLLPVIVVLLVAVLSTVK